MHRVSARIVTPTRGLPFFLGPRRARVVCNTSCNYASRTAICTARRSIMYTSNDNSNSNDRSTRDNRVTFAKANISLCCYGPCRLRRSRASAICIKGPRAQLSRRYRHHSTQGRDTSQAASNDRNDDGDDDDVHSTQNNAHTDDYAKYSVKRQRRRPHGSVRSGTGRHTYFRASSSRSSKLRSTQQERPRSAEEEEGNMAKRDVHSTKQDGEGTGGSHRCRSRYDSWRGASNTEETGSWLWLPFMGSSTRFTTQCHLPQHTHPHPAFVSGSRIENAYTKPASTQASSSQHMHTDRNSSSSDSASSSSSVCEHRSTPYCCLTADTMRRLEKAKLTHVTPDRVNDHVCIAMVKALRWVADKLFRERYIHRATMLKTLGPSLPAALFAATYVRLLCRPQSQLDLSPFVCRYDKENQTQTPQTPQRQPFMHSSATWSTPSTMRSSSSRHRGAAAINTTAAELRGLLSQVECATVHYQILLLMAEIKSIERAVVLVVQGIHFALLFPLFVVHPRMGFRLMAYLCEESSVVWTQMINDMDMGKIEMREVPQLAYAYWGLRSVLHTSAVASSSLSSPSSFDNSVTTQGVHSAEHVGSLAVGAFRQTAATTPATGCAEHCSQAIHDSAGDNEEEGRGGSSSDRATGTGLATDVNSASETTPDEEGNHTRKDDKRGSAHDDVNLRGCDETQSTRGGDQKQDPLQSLTLRDVVLLIRSDEMLYRDCNHVAASMLDRQPPHPRSLWSRFIRWTT